MGSFFSYVFLGLSLSAPIGPINAAQLDKGIRNGFFHAWLLGIGGLMADIIYMILIYLGIVHFLDKDIIQSFLWSFGTFVLLYTGIESIKGAKNITIQTNKRNDSIKKAFFFGFFMSISSPLTIMFWLGIFGAVLAKAAQSANSSQLFLSSLGIILGIMLWDITIASTSSIFRKVLNKRILAFITILSGLSLIIYGFYFGFHAFQSIFF